MADSVGNRLGARAYFTYIDDAGDSYAMLLDESVSTAVGNTPATGTEPIIQASSKRPLEPRYAIFSLNDDPSIKKRVIIGDPESNYMTTTQSLSVSINEVGWNLSSRHGEKRQIVIPAPPEPAP